MTHADDRLQAIAESAAPLARELARQLQRRPAPTAGGEPLSRDSLAALCRELDELLDDAVPALRELVEDMAECEPEDVDELFDELAPPAFDLVDMAHRIWAAPLPGEAESLRPPLASLAEEPVARIMNLLLHILHAVINPWIMTDAPEQPVIAFTPALETTAQRAALQAWRKAHPGIIPDDILR